MSLVFVWIFWSVSGKCGNARCSLSMRKLLFLSFICSVNASAAESYRLIGTAEDACKLLINRAEKEVWFPTIKKGLLLCDEAPSINKNAFIVRLSNGTPFDAEHNYPHSTLLDWFAIKKHGGAVMSYDIGESRMVPLMYGTKNSE
ncbi:MAG TPA: hypothetical protein PK129_06055 [Cellvibrionaceae bacterium]|nr:hypothetical protein [Cellvibrionaceae bacterium]